MEYEVPMEYMGQFERVLYECLILRASLKTNGASFTAEQRRVLRANLSELLIELLEGTNRSAQDYRQLSSNAYGNKETH